MPDDGFVCILLFRQRGAYLGEVEECCWPVLRTIPFTAIWTLFINPQDGSYLVVELCSLIFDIRLVCDLQRWVTWQKVMTVALTKENGIVIRMIWSPDGA